MDNNNGILKEKTGADYLYILSYGNNIVIVPSKEHTNMTPWRNPYPSTYEIILREEDTLQKFMPGLEELLSYNYQEKEIKRIMKHTFSRNGHSQWHGRRIRSSQDTAIIDGPYRNNPDQYSIKDLILKAKIARPNGIGKLLGI